MSAPTIASNDPARIDRYAVIVSALCAAHCLLTPLLITLLPAFAVELESSEILHPLFVLIALPLGYSAMKQGFQKHNRRLPALLVTVGLMCLTAAIFIHEPHEAETIITLIGSGLIASAHMLNARYCANCPKCTG